MSKKKQSVEAHAYTPGLKIKGSVKIVKLRRLPVLGKVFVKVNDEVEFTTPIAEAMVQGDPYVLSVASQLGVENNAINDYIKKKQGDNVKKDEKIAGFDAFFGLWKNWVTAPIDGYIESISNVSGQVVIREHPHPVTIDSYISGKVVEVVPGEGARIETNAAYIQGIFGVGGETHGEIQVLADDPTKVVDEKDIPDAIKGKILVGGSRVTKAALLKCIKLGASGLVVGGIMDTDLMSTLGYEIGVAITGEEDLGISLIITEGFGQMSMNPRTLELLKKFEGYQAAINGATQIRAGVIRPEIIIPHTNVVEDEGEEFSGGMIVGTSVRIIRTPYFGALGKVKSLPIELQIAETESKIRVLEVELEDGQTVTVPRANVEIIEI